jgi:5-methylcytosine-specific restriction endonuclease McrA
MALSRTAKFYRDNPEARKKHQKSSEKWNKSEKGKAYKKKKNETPEEKRKKKQREEARKKMGLKRGDKRTVDHKRPLSKGGSNHKSNLKVTSAKKNFTKNKK